MGSSVSKTARAAGGAAARKYPTKPSSATTAPSRSAAPAVQESDLGPIVHPEAGARDIRDATINNDASDPVLASNLRQIGPVASNPYQSQTATQPKSAAPANRGLPAQVMDLSQEPPPGLFPNAASMRSNPALLVLQARNRLAEKADREFSSIGRPGFEGREFMDVYMITDALKMRMAGRSNEEIEKKIGLKKGVIARLGEKGVLEPAYV